MRFILVHLTTFARKWSAYGLSDDDLRSLELLLLDDPMSGDLIPGTGGLRKLRFAPPSWRTGKRGASRVIYAYIEVGHAVYLFTLYGKNEQSDLTPEEKKIFRRTLERLHAWHKVGR